MTLVTFKQALLLTTMVETGPRQFAPQFMRQYPMLKLDQSTISKILKKKSKLEMAMNLWVSQVTTAGLILTDELLKLKGREFAQHLNVSADEIKFSNGWIANFKKRNSLRRYKLHGEALSGPLESLPGERIKLQELLSQYESDDIYNADETGLFYRMLPH
ncbi:2628_t:CDS:2 [Gigaspora rosea]|nr:2628_t:CDS:2 [Gigaspora rosea]